MARGLLNQFHQLGDSRLELLVFPLDHGSVFVHELKIGLGLLILEVLAGS